MVSSGRETPLRLALKARSSQQASVEDGIRGVRKLDRACLARNIREAFADSLDLDGALTHDHPQENRWDYLLGHTASEQVVGLERHSAKTDEISTVINKRKAAKVQLAKHLRPGAHVSKWLWVAPGKNHFADTEKARRRLDENGIQFVGSQVLAKHLYG